jgi:hypothetical protein
MVTFACGHTKMLDLLSTTSEEVKQATLALLERSYCASCHRLQRQAFARALRDTFGLAPLVGQDAAQNDLAEEVRIHLFEMLYPSLSDEALPALVAVLLLRTDALFWIERRSLLWSTNKQRIALTLLDLLQPRGGEGKAEEWRLGMRVDSQSLS